jgi:AraC-like DNA-binding protein
MGAALPSLFSPLAGRRLRLACPHAGRVVAPVTLSEALAASGPRGYLRHVQPRPSTATRLRLAREFIDECLDQPLDLGLMAERAELSRFHFVRAFRQEFQTTPHRYLQERRIERAKQLLAAGSLSVTDVCFEVGFESLGSFSTLFRRLVGLSPGSYRARRLVAVPALQPARPAVFVPTCYLRSLGLAA